MGFDYPPTPKGKKVGKFSESYEAKKEPKKKGKPKQKMKSKMPPGKKCKTCGK